MWIRQQARSIPPPSSTSKPLIKSSRANRLRDGDGDVYITANDINSDSDEEDNDVSDNSDREQDDIDDAIDGIELGLRSALITQLSISDAGGLCDAYLTKTKNAFVSVHIMIAYIRMMDDFLKMHNIPRPFILQLDGCVCHVDPELILFAQLKLIYLS